MPLIQYQEDPARGALGTSTIRGPKFPGFTEAPRVEMPRGNVLGVVAQGIGDIAEIAEQFRQSRIQSRLATAKVGISNDLNAFELSLTGRNDYEQFLPEYEETFGEISARHLEGIDDREAREELENYVALRNIDTGHRVALRTWEQQRETERGRTFEALDNLERRISNEQDPSVLLQEAEGLLSAQEESGYVSPTEKGLNLQSFRDEIEIDRLEKLIDVGPIGQAQSQLEKSLLKKRDRDVLKGRLEQRQRWEIEQTNREDREARRVLKGNQDLQLANFQLAIHQAENETVRLSILNEARKATSRNAIRPGQFAKLMEKVDRPSDLDDSETVKEYNYRFNTGDYDEDIFDEIYADPNLRHESAVALMTKVRQISGEGDISKTEPYKQGIAFIRAAFDEVNTPLQRLLGGAGEEMPTRLAIEEFDSRVRSGEDPFEVRLDVVTKHGKVDKVIQAIPFMFGGSTDEKGRIDVDGAFQSLRAAFNNGSIQEDTYYSQLEYIELFDKINEFRAKYNR